MQGTRCQQQQQGEVFLAVLDLAVCHITSVHTLTQISAVSKRCREICTLHANHQLQPLLLPLLRQSAASLGGQLRHHHLGSIKWLCSKASKEAFAAASEAAMAVARVPFSEAHMLVKARVRVSNAALLAAVLKQQPGAEEWMQARIAVHGVTAGDSEDTTEMIAMTFPPEDAARMLRISVEAAAAIQPSIMLEMVALALKKEEVCAAEDVPHQ
jgi:hypothetical protein